MVQERWLPVLQYESLYEVSDLGRVRSKRHVVVRRNGTTQTIKERVLKQNIAIRGGYAVLKLARNGNRKHFSVHFLVARAFIGPRPTGHEVAHWDGNPENPCLTNLRYATPVENDHDKIRHGTRPRGEINGHAVLTEDDVLKIRSMIASGAVTQSQMADEYRISRGHMSMIVNRKIWVHI